MQKYNILDIVKTKDNGNILYLVTDVQDFTKPVNTGQKPILDIDYELMQIYPVRTSPRYLIMGQDDIDLHVKDGSKGFNVLMEMIQKERERAGLFGTPDFLNIAKKNKLAERNHAIMKDNVNNKNTDIVRYDLLETIDDCLDALNDLGTLYFQFEDIAYLQLKEIVYERIKTLQKANTNTKKKRK